MHCLIHPLIVVGTRTLKSHHPVRRRASIRSCFAQGTIKERNDGEPTVRNHPTTIIAIQPPEQRRCRVEDTNYTQPDKSIQNFRLRKTQEAPSNMTAFYSHGYHDMQHGNTCDSTSSKIQQKQTRRSDACLTRVTFNLLEKQSQANDQEHCAADANQHGLKVFGSDVTAKQMSI